MPRVSVLLPVYNTKEEYLRETIESILNQTFADFELLILDDGSTDENVEKVVLSYKDKRIKYQKQQNQGIAKTRNNLMDMAKGEYLALCDHDDISLPKRFEKQVKFLDEHPEAGGVSAWYEYFPNNKHIEKKPYNPKLFDMYRDCCFAQQASMLRKDFFDKFNLRYDSEYCPADDYELWTRAIRYFELYNIQEVLLKYRWHSENESFANKKKNWNATTRAAENILKFLEGDEKKRQKLADFLTKPDKWYQNIFALKKEWHKGTKWKTIIILGKKIYICECK